MRCLANPVVALSAFFALNACVASDCTGDPRYMDTAEAYYCIGSGGTKRHTEALGLEAETKTTLAASVRAENARLNAQLASLNERERAAARRLMAANSELAALDQRLVSRRASQQITEAEYQLGRSQLRGIDAQRRTIKLADPAAEERVRALQRAVDELRRVLG